MADFSNHGLLAAFTGPGTEDQLFTRAVAAHARGMVRNTVCTFVSTAGLGATNAIFRIRVNDATTAVNLATWATLLSDLVPAGNPAAQIFQGDIRLYFDAGANGVNIVGSAETSQAAGANAAVGSMSIGGKYQF